MNMILVQAIKEWQEFQRDRLSLASGRFASIVLARVVRLRHSAGIKKYSYRRQRSR